MSFLCKYIILCLLGRLVSFKICLMSEKGSLWQELESLNTAEVLSAWNNLRERFEDIEDEVETASDQMERDFPALDHLIDRIVMGYCQENPDATEFDTLNVHIGAAMMALVLREVALKNKLPSLID